MNSDNNIPKLLGAAFLVVAVTSILSLILFDMTVGSSGMSDGLVNIANRSTQMMISILLDIATSLGIVVLGVLLFTVLKNQNKIVALVALGWYIAEATILAVSKVGALSLIPLSIEYVEVGAPDPSYFQTLGTLFLGVDRFGYNIHMVFFTLGALLFYSLFYRSKYIPRFLSVWGMAAVSLAFIGTILVFFDIKIIFLVLPNMLFELTIGAWLIVEGIESHKLGS